MDGTEGNLYEVVLDRGEEGKVVRYVIARDVPAVVAELYPILRYGPEISRITHLAHKVIVAEQPEKG